MNRPSQAGHRIALAGIRPKNPFLSLKNRHFIKNHRPTR